MTETVYFFDIVNVAFILALLAVVQFRYRLSWSVMALLLLHVAIIFLTNRVLFDPGYMPDQAKYLRVAMAVRGSGETIAEASWNLPVGITGVFFGLFPIPLINSVYSIGIINFLLYLIVFLFLYRQGYLRGLGMWLYLLYPSLLLYTSLSLRDTVIFLLMVISFWFYLKDRVTLSIVAQLPLIILKFQNLAIYGLSLILFFFSSIFRPRLVRRPINPAVAYVFLMLFTIAVPFIYRYGLMGLNLYRHWMWTEDVGIRIQPIPETQINGFVEFVRETLKSIPYFLLKPLPWEAENALQRLQSIENLMVAAVVIALIWRAYWHRAHNRYMDFLLLYFLISLAIYGLVVWNFGTAARYKFTYVALFLIFYASLYEMELQSRRDASLSLTRQG